MNKIVKTASIKLMSLTKTKFKAVYVHPIHLDDHTPYIFMSNHQSLFDIPLIYATIPGTIRFVAKMELFSIPAFGKMLTISGCIPIDRNKPTYQSDFYQQAKTRLQNKIMLWIFPEGTRSRDKSLLTFKTGSFRLAQEIAAKIIPVGIRNTRSVLRAGKYTLGFNQIVEIVIGKPINTADYQNEEELESLINAVRQSIKQLMDNNEDVQNEVTS